MLTAKEKLLVTIGAPVSIAEARMNALPVQEAVHKRMRWPEGNVERRRRLKRVPNDRVQVIEVIADEP